MNCKTCNDSGELAWCFCGIEGYVPANDFPAPLTADHRHPRDYRACPDCDNLPLRLFSERQKEIARLGHQVAYTIERIERLSLLVPVRIPKDDHNVWHMRIPEPFC